MANSESDVIAAINDLEDESLQDQWAAHDEAIDHNLQTMRGFDDYNSDWHDQRGNVRCEVCLGEWHGLPRNNGCPGPFGSEDAKVAYQVGHDRTRVRLAERAAEARQLTSPGSGYARVTTTFAASDGSLAGCDIAVPRDTYQQPEFRDPAAYRNGTRVIQIASPQMQEALVQHIEQYPEDTETLMRRFRDLIFTPDGRPVPWTRGGLRTVLGNDHHVDWAMEQIDRASREQR